VQPAVLLQYVKGFTNATALPHIRFNYNGNVRQDSIIMDAATRRNLEITQNLAGGGKITLALRCFG